MYYSTRDAISLWVVACAAADRELRRQRQEKGERGDNKMFYPARHMRDSLALREADLEALEDTLNGKAKFVETEPQAG